MDKDLEILVAKREILILNSHLLQYKIKDLSGEIEVLKVKIETEKEEQNRNKG